jgi:hypothetical protein
MLLGNSGSPVIRENDFTAIGVHVYGGEFNSASVIGQYGNPFLDYVAAFDLRAQNASAPTVALRPGVLAHFYSVPTSKTPDVIKAPVDLASGTFSKFTLQQGFAQGANPKGAPSQAGTKPNHRSFARPTGASQRRVVNGTTSTQNQKLHATAQSLTVPNGHSIDEEGFMDIFKKAIQIGGPILGAVGGPLGGLASVALSAAGSFAQTIGAEGALDGPSLGPLTAPHGTVERAVMAEAALCALLEMDEQTLEEEGFFDIMKSVVGGISSVVKSTAPQVLDVIGPAALKLAVDALKKNNTNGAESFYNEQPRVPIVRMPNLPTTGQDAFLARLAANNDGEAEGFLGDIFGAALSVGSVIGKGLLGSLAESTVDGPEPAPMQVMDGIWQRAVVAEAALQAVLQAPQDVLEEEGFFGSFIGQIKKIAPVIMKHAPAVISAVGPVVKSVLGVQESIQTPVLTLRKARSGASLRSGASGGAQSEFWSRAKAMHTGTDVAY